MILPIDFDALRRAGLYDGPRTNASETARLSRPGSSLNPASPRILREFNEFRERFPNNRELNRIGQQLDSGIRLNDNVLSTALVRALTTEQQNQLRADIESGNTVRDPRGGGLFSNLPDVPASSIRREPLDTSGMITTGNRKVDSFTASLIGLGLSPEAANSANQVLIQEAAIPFSQGGRLQEPKGTGPGLFGTALGVLGGLATFGAGIPAGLGVASNLFNAGSAANRGDPLGAFGSLAAAGLTDIGGIRALGNGQGFTNPDALGLSGNNLGLNFASGNFAAQPVSGFGTSALGLNGAQLGLNFASGAFPAVAPRSTIGANALGLDARDLFRSTALGEAPLRRSVLDDLNKAFADAFGVQGAQGGGTTRFTVGRDFQLQPVQNTIGQSTPSPFSPLDFRLPDRIRQELDNPFPAFGLATGIRFPDRLGRKGRLRAFNQQARGGQDTARTIELSRRAA